MAGYSVTPISAAAWTRAHLAGIPTQSGAALPVIAPGDVRPILPGHDVWDMWQIMRSDGATWMAAGRSWWFFLTTICLDDPEDRHDRARIRLFSHHGADWHDHGWTFAPGFTPGSREWSGSAVIDADGELTMYFTAAGRREGPHSFEQRLFETRTTMRVHGGKAEIADWSEPRESLRADEQVYARADQAEAPTHGIRGFRDPGYFRDPADGSEYLLFTGSAAHSAIWPDGVIGMGKRGADGWSLLPPVVTAIGVNSELERPHIVCHAGRYYLFWSTHSFRFADGIAAPTGLYAMVADQVAGPWRPVNGTGLVAGNPNSAPMQAYCWCVTAELNVISFANYWRGGPATLPAQASARRATFGGTVAPSFQLKIDGDSIGIGVG